MGDLSNPNNPTKSMSSWYFEVLPNDPQNYARDYALFTVMCYINARYYYNKAIISTMYMNLLCPHTFQDKLQLTNNSLAMDFWLFQIFAL